ncbi:hypothetical protein LFWB_2490 [Candidatus Phytoplasma luffae]|uniref:Immunodominant membrane protein n=1 Tax=Loofah witches'-broom phytoplasma TaxID=35773 RepID=A0A975FJ30_LOWBP|nr:hypothetical protein [Candidatus Phytoplasma luffae]QTX02819.1 hypothetical protein LFWB_2490 [Candidatus Phytoplasma luffae]
MQQRESFLKTKNGKIVVGIVVTLVLVALGVLGYMFINSDKMANYKAKVKKMSEVVFTDADYADSDKSKADKLVKQYTEDLFDTSKEDYKQVIVKFNKDKEEAKKIDAKKVEDVKKALTALKDEAQKDGVTVNNLKTKHTALKAALKELHKELEEKTKK